MNRLYGATSTISKVTFKKDARVFKAGAVIGSVFASTYSYLFYLTGIVGIALFAADPQISQILTDNSDLVAPYVITTIASPLLAAIFMAALFAAMMSTADSLRMLAAGSFVRDIYTAVVGKKVSEIFEVRLTRIEIVILVFLALPLALDPPGLIMDMVVVTWGSMAAAFMPVVFLGLYWTRVNKQGAIGGLIIGPITVVL